MTNSSTQITKEYVDDAIIKSEKRVIAQITQMGTMFKEIVIDIKDDARRHMGALQEGFRDELHVVVDMVYGLNEKTDRMEKDITVIKSDMSDMKNDIAVLKDDVVILKEDVAILKEDVSILKDDVSVLKQDVSILKEDVSVLKHDVSILKVDMSEVKSTLSVKADKKDIVRHARRLDKLEAIA